MVFEIKSKHLVWLLWSNLKADDGTCIVSADARLQDWQEMTQSIGSKCCYGFVTKGLKYE